MTCKIENLDKVISIYETYADKKIKQKDIKKTIDIDTYLYDWELEKNKLQEIDKLAPF
ncbi:MAG: hypothetical protein ACOZBL_02750 [Patescibacteria group bacterium]